MRRILEKVYPVLIALAVCLTLYLWGPEVYKFNRLEFILNSTITFSVTYIGFIITSVTILVGLSDKALIKYLRKEHLIETLSKYFIVPIILGTMLILYSFYLGYDVDTTCIVIKYKVLIFIFLFVSFFMSLFRVSKLIIYIFKTMNKNEVILTKEKPQRISTSEAFAKKED